MGGSILLIVLISWVLLAKVIAKFFLSRMQLEAGMKNTLVYVGLFIMTFIAPVADEIIGGFQFRAMCTPENMLVYDSEKVRGKALQYKDVPSYSIDDMILPARVTQSEWVNPSTGEVLITHRIFYSSGGLLSRLIGFPEGNSPLTFNGQCDLREYYELFDKLNIQELEGRYGEQ